MRLPLHWVLFLLTAVSYVLYPVWNLPFHPAAQWVLLNLFILLAAGALYSPLSEVSLDLDTTELKALWPALLLGAAVCLPFWLTPLPTGSDDQSHAGPAAWVLARAAAAAGLDIRLLPLLGLPAAGLLAWGAWRLIKKGVALPDRDTAVVALAAAGNLWFLAERFFGAAGAVGRWETVLRYPPLSKFLYLGAYLLLGVNEAAQRETPGAMREHLACKRRRLLAAPDNDHDALRHRRQLDRGVDILGGLLQPGNDPFVFGDPQGLNRGRPDETLGIGQQPLEGVQRR